ncbi:MAG TPA: FAD-dependent oxidoreductase [Burkholderiales bacterium]|nr:FAD-dependent oxidoreductase [Burkholderiales bacterium]
MASVGTRWDHACDVLVVGFGAAGAVAAIEAHDRGADVLLIEKMADPGGISILSAGGIRIAYDANGAFEYLRTTCGGRTSEDVLRVLADGMAELPDYVRQLARVDAAEIGIKPAVGNYPFPGCDDLGYVEVTAIPGFSPDVPYHAAWPMRPGCYLFKLLEDNVRHRAIPAWFSTQAIELVRDPQGITGVVAERDGTTLRIKAKRAVVLTCGGFEADPTMQRQYFDAHTVLTGSFRGNTGDGIRMCQAVGSDLWHMWHYHGPYGFRHSDPAFPFGLYVKLLPMWTPQRTSRPLPIMPWIIVDRHGRRYVNEYPPYMSDTGVRSFGAYDPDACSYARMPSWLLFDEAGRKLFPMGRSIVNDREHRYEWSRDNLREVELGILKRADTLPELARTTGIDPDRLVQTVRKWNAACTSGADPEHGRRPETMMRISEPPFYAGEVWPVVINTQGGPVHDARQRVLDTHRRPIPRLYAAGELGSVFGHVYMAGGNLAECFVGGRNAARDAAALPAWDD